MRRRLRRPTRVPQFDQFSRSSSRLPTARLLSKKNRGMVQDNITGGEMTTRETCCDDLLKGFTFDDIRRVKPPRKKGVYVVRVVKKGTAIEGVIEGAKQAIARLRWPSVEKKMSNRIARLSRIGQCPIIYIGAAGPGAKSKNALEGRYEDFSGRHTAMYPLWALLYFGWKLEYGYKEEIDPARAEDLLKQHYRQLHDNRLPALTGR